MVQNDKTLKRQDDAVSEIIGEILMLAITVMIFAILIATVSAMISRPPTEIVRMDVQALSDTTLTIRHMGGDTVPYTQLAVVVDGNVISATASDTNANSRWDLGENLLVSGVNTSHSLRVLVYDSMTNNVLGDFTIDTLPAGLPVTQPSPSPSPSASPSPSVSPSPGPQVTIGGNAWIANVQGSGSGWITYTMDVVLQVDNTGSAPAYDVLATCDIPIGGQANGVKNIQLISSPAVNPRNVAGYSNTQYTWRYSMQLQQNHDTVFFDLSAQGSNTNSITKRVTFNG